MRSTPLYFVLRFLQPFLYSDQGKELPFGLLTFLQLAEQDKWIFVLSLNKMFLKSGTTLCLNFVANFFRAALLFEIKNVNFLAFLLGKPFSKSLCRTVEALIMLPISSETACEDRIGCYLTRRIRESVVPKISFEGFHF